MNSQILVNVIRGDTIESVHRGHLIILAGNRRTIASAGDPATVTFFRSSSKSFQAVPVITSGAADAFGFTDDEIALMCASHSGEPMHVERVGRMLAKIGLSETDLQCGSHLPFNEAESTRMLSAGESPTQLHNNCSGKHAGMLAFAKYAGADIGNYLSAESPVQQAILKCVSDFCEVAENEISIGTDGCSAPNFALPVSAMAMGFVNLIAPAQFDSSTRDACSRIISAMIKYPQLIGGTDRLDTMLMQAAKGRLVSKVGAEGVWLCGVLPSTEWPAGLAIALKIEDGDDQRARPVVAIELLRRLGILEPDVLADFSPMPIKNRRGKVVGSAESIFEYQPAT